MVGHAITLRELSLENVSRRSEALLVKVAMNGTMGQTYQSLVGSNPAHCCIIAGGENGRASRGELIPTTVG